ncbi:MAG: Ig-like domain-containing protein, partial [Clostridia bacterium]|nr:Ig-like domain-containing protein [Clostridia bacterium]
TITYDSDILTLKTLKKCTLTNSGAFDYVDNNGTAKIVWNATDDITGNGALFKATFSAAAGSYSSTDLFLSYDPRDTFDSDWNTVVFDCEGTTLREYIPQEYAVYWHINDKEYKTMQLEGAEIWIPNVIPAHYTVVGWNPEIPATMPPQEMHFTALLSPTLYTATFYIDGVAVYSQEYTIETEKLNEPEIPPKPYCFAKWQGYNLKTGGDLEIHAVYDPPRIIAPAQKTLHIDETYRIITSGNFDTTRYVWKSDNTTVATVDKHGNVTAVGIGTAVITVTRYGEDALGNEVSAKTSTTIKVSKEKVKYNSFSEWLKAFVERFFDEIIYDILENLKRIGFILAFRVN